MAKDFDETTQDLGGKAKEAFGEATDNRSIENEGKADQAKSDIKEKAGDAADAVKDKANEVLGKFKDDEK
ncbi:CsbD family protein [Corynebacterium doosanense]|uniref:General stress protein CsbD n=1 Tax=Corynebacterium doosanense CAU 212 = DSM 45436 TaxID=558173 RepID=A0A097ID86_9CORY|nr:CsbD family protein [Corynebacterium doosanense]AIT60091.1 general stress protein CsbD [Corynebacterium doosanense CAU 212 = DSM 45436]